MADIGEPPPTADDLFPIEELSRRTGMTVRTLRAYQSRKLLPAPEVRTRTGYYDDRHVARVELVKDLQGQGFKLDTIARMLDNTGGSDAEILQFTRTVQSLFGETEHQITDRTDLAERFQVGVDAKDADDLLSRAEKLGLLRQLGDDRYEELAPRVLRAGEAAVGAMGGDVKRVLRIVEQLRRHAEGIAKIYLELYLERVWKPFNEAGQPEDQWATVQGALKQVRSLAEEALLGIFDLVMAEQIDDIFGREFARGPRPRAAGATTPAGRSVPIPPRPIDRTPSRNPTAAQSPWTVLRVRSGASAMVSGTAAQSRPRTTS
jgi:DNA-binding transcriptional MerR regulator